MADILPADPLPTVVETAAVDVTFTASLESDETLVSISIINHTPNDGITVAGARFYGAYRDSFTLAPGGLKYRYKPTGEYLSVQKFSDLPADPMTAHLYEFNAPSVLTTDFVYTVELVYDVEPPETAPPGTDPERNTITETRTQTVKGSWSTWAQQMRDYVAGGT